MKPIDQYIADPGLPDCVRVFLRWARFEAANDETPPPLFANHRDCRVRVVTARPTAFVGITPDLGALAPRFFVGLDRLEAFLDAPYPRNFLSLAQQAPIGEPDEDPEDVLEACCERAGIAPSEFAERAHLDARNLAVAELHLAKVPNRQIAALLGLNRFLVRIALQKTGLGYTDDPDATYARSLWADGPLPIGPGVGQIPSPAAARIELKGYATICDGVVVAAPRARFPSARERVAA